MDHGIEALERRRLLSGHSLAAHVHVGTQHHHNHHQHFALVVEVGSIVRESHKPSAMFSQVSPRRPFARLEFGQIETFGFGQTGTFDALFEPFGFGQLPTFNAPDGVVFGFNTDPT